MDLISLACLTFGPVLLAIGAIVVSGNHKIAGIWIIFCSIVFISLGFCLQWQTKVMEKEKSTVAAQIRKHSNPEDKLSDSDIQKIVDGVAEKLKESGQSGEAVFGIDKKRIIPTTKIKPLNLYINWSTGRIIDETADEISILLPYMRGDLGINKDVEISDNILVIHKIVGNRSCPFGSGTDRVCAEVVSIDKGVTVVRIGIVSLDE